MGLWLLLQRGQSGKHFSFRFSFNIEYLWCIQAKYELKRTRSVVWLKRVNPLVGNSAARKNMIGAISWNSEFKRGGVAFSTVIVPGQEGTVSNGCKLRDEVVLRGKRLLEDLSHADSWINFLIQYSHQRVQVAAGILHGGVNDVALLHVWEAVNNPSAVLCVPSKMLHSSFCFGM